MKIISSMILISVSFIGLSFGQETNTSQGSASDSIVKSRDEVKPPVQTVIEEFPEFPGGEEAMMNFIFKNVNYPKEAKKNKIKGRVIVKFLVDKEGNIEDPKVVKGLGAGCDEEAIRVVQLMPKWKPGKQNGRPVNVTFNLPIAFGL